MDPCICCVYLNNVLIYIRIYCFIHKFRFTICFTHHIRNSYIIKFLQFDFSVACRCTCRKPTYTALYQHCLHTKNVRYVYEALAAR